MGPTFSWMVLDKAIAIGGFVYPDGETVHSLALRHALERPTLRLLPSCLGYLRENTAGVMDTANVQTLRLNGRFDRRVGPQIFCRTDGDMILPLGIKGGDD
jgi:uncharacterized protein YigE (DUF2233 family)